ncbi:hypothetical protein VK792_17895 [Mesobacterium sp. TK19101]|uniref:Uncharacterized protein n=1 Tax=Mesobacterium hydrothermale TaxID=3111907 RepID=A0ABU6HMM0_9RHOB|nr:hypothetical protein [Mesobacterium sp. TK19101]MEC3863169.1 hypothetical protein [Mesobacterium sp. TK19101]
MAGLGQLFGQKQLLVLNFLQAGFVGFDQGLVVRIDEAINELRRFAIHLCDLALNRRPVFFD